MAAHFGCRCILKSANKFVFPGNVIGRIPTGIRRSFLSASYACDEAWLKRLNEPIIKTIELSNYYIELDRKFSSEKRISAIDLDLFAHRIDRSDMLEEFEDLLRRFRNTPDCIRFQPSTSHAVVKLFLQFGQFEWLMKIINDKSNYGIFPSYYCFNLMMDTFLKRQNYRDAARVATEVMLQEDFSHPITTNLALFSCLSYLKSPLPEPWIYEPPPPEPEPEENIVIRLNYLPPNYFDGHFDLTDPEKLLGKTLLKLGQMFPDQVGRTCQIMGNAMYEKWENLHKCLERFLQDASSQKIYKEGIERARMHLHKIPDDDNKTRQQWEEKLNPLLDRLEQQSTDCSSLDVVRDGVTAAVRQQEAADIAAQLKLHEQWTVNRASEVERQINEYIRSTRLKKLQEMREDLQKREQLLFFFENFEKHAMKVEAYDEVAKEVALKQMKDDDASYVPPEVQQRRPVPKS